MPVRQHPTDPQEEPSAVQGNLGVSAAKEEKRTLTDQPSAKGGMGEPIEVLPVREIKTLFSWRAPVRLFRRRNREFWTTVLSIAFLLGVILFFIEEWLLIAVIVALIFVYYVLSSVPPEEVEHQITNRGIRFAGRDYFWEDIICFWISQKGEQKILNFEMIFGFPKRLALLFKGEDEKTIRGILKKYLSEEEPPPSFLDKASDKLAKIVPLETN